MDLSKIPSPRTFLEETIVDSEVFHSTDLKTLDHEDSLDHQEFKNHSVSKRSVIK